MRTFNCDTPLLLAFNYKDLEIIQSRLVIRFAKILSHSVALQAGHMDALKSHLANVEATLAQVDPARDQDIFIEHNIRPFQAPSDWAFEPCINHYDTASVQPRPTLCHGRSRGLD